MEIEKLLITTEYVKWIENSSIGVKWSENNESLHVDYADIYMHILLYANFIAQPINLEMFVPCNEKGKYLEEPIILNGEGIPGYVALYNKAKDKVLFKGWKYNEETGILVDKETNELSIIDIAQYTIEEIIILEGKDLIPTKNCLEHLEL